MSQRAIGIFDSGVGGLTVLKEVRRLLPQEHLVYLGDTARVPYGTKSPHTVLRYAMEAGEFLVGQGIKLLVVACNTASSVAITALEERFRLPVVGVIEPGAARACTLTRSGQVAVIGTEGTMASGAYPRAIQGLRAEVGVESIACPLFVPLAEEGWAEHPVAELAAAEYLAPLQGRGIDTLVLGCTHYPLLKNTLARVLGDAVTLVDSAAATAQVVQQRLSEVGLTRAGGDPGQTRLFVTDVPTRFQRVGGAFLGAPLDQVRQVNIDGHPGWPAVQSA